ncbi:DUF2218 domain-containing protein [Kribbella speibonae]|uniref:DUF2218 domain-containing protein n=1 Tax=Kribbella speibonae TaxID=1572660 RepID=UPI0013F4555A|nr:DUF2218 domain-containing protein [Kribbella speibonae]
MPALEAHLGTPRAERYLAQLTSHLSHGPGGLTVLSTSAEELVVDLGTATWSVRAAPAELLLRVEADDADELEQQSARVAHRVEQIARRDGLQVVWQQA